MDLTLGHHAKDGIEVIDSSNRREEQELSMRCLHILRSCLGFINTLMIQDILAGPQWADVLGDAGRRGLTPLFTSNMTPYGDIQPGTTRRLALGGGGAITGQAADPPGRRDR